MTFGPGSTYGPEGVGAETRLHGPDLDRDRVHGRRRCIAWIVYENRRLIAYALGRRDADARAAAARDDGAPRRLT